MKNLITILCLCSFLFSIGERVDHFTKFTINEINKLDIIGWSNKDGQWIKQEGIVDLYITPSFNKDYKLFLNDITLYEVKEKPDLFIMKLNPTPPNPSDIYGMDFYEKIILIHKDELKKIKFKYQKLDKIEIEVFSYRGLNNGLFLETCNSFINNYLLNQEDQNYYKKSYTETILRLDYYCFDDTIQYLISMRTRTRTPKTKRTYYDKKWFEYRYDLFSSENLWINVLKEISENNEFNKNVLTQVSVSGTRKPINEFLEKYYFESNFGKFKKTFLKD